jgi:hypothetical protein
VDWWDADAQRWRPTIIERTSEDEAGWRSHVQIIVPVTGGVEHDLVIVMSRQVRIADVRPSQLLDEYIVQFFSTQYTLEMIESLMPCIRRVTLEEQAQLRGVVEELVATNRETYAGWLRAFTTGAEPDSATSTDVWEERAIDPARLPDAGADDVFAAVRRSRAAGEIQCSPVALWDETARRWRPTMMLDAVAGDGHFRPGREDQVLVPGEPVDVALVSSSLLQPIDIADTCFSLLAIPVLARDFLRMHEALASAGLAAAAIAAHPSMIALARMLHGAAEEWRGVYEDGLIGPAPEPRVAQLHPSLWGFTRGAAQRRT